MYRTVQCGVGWSRAVIVHLCVASEHRRKGVAKRLVDELCKLTKNTILRVELKCRRDFDANRMWPRIGFTYSGDTNGRTGLPLNRWHLTFHELPLMAISQERTIGKRFLAAIDCNILFRLQDPVPTTSAKHERNLHEEAKALLEDWLSEDVTLAITNEALNEIQRQNDSDERRRRAEYARNFHQIQSHRERSKSLYDRLSEYFPAPLSDNLESDIKQVCETIAGGAYCLITQDRALLRKASLIEEMFDTKVMSPGEFIGVIVKCCV